MRGNDKVVAALLGASADSTLKVQGRTAIAWAQERGQSEAEALLEEPLAARVVSAFILACGRAGKPEEALSLYDEHIRPADARVPRPERSKALAYVMNGFARRGDLDSARALLDGFDGDVSSLHVNAMLQAYLTLSG